MTAVLFVCLGNICRSPTAEAVFRHRANAIYSVSGLQVDSAGTGSWHQGKSPDPRAVKAAARRGYDLTAIRARTVEFDDFHHFDFILAMDRENLKFLHARCPADFPGHLGLFLQFGEYATKEVPDPYYGGEQGFDQVLDLIESASDGLLAHMQKP